MVQTSVEGLKKDVFLGKVADLLLEKHQWIENRIHKISDLMKKAGKMPEVSCCNDSCWLLIVKFLRCLQKIVEE